LNVEEKKKKDEKDEIMKEIYLKEISFMVSCVSKI